MNEAMAFGTLGNPTFWNSIFRAFVINSRKNLIALTVVIRQFMCLALKLVMSCSIWWIGSKFCDYVNVVRYLKHDYCERCAMSRAARKTCSEFTSVTGEFTPRIGGVRRNTIQPSSLACRLYWTVHILSRDFVTMKCINKELHNTAVFLAMQSKLERCRAPLTRLRHWTFWQSGRLRICPSTRDRDSKANCLVDIKDTSLNKRISVIVHAHEMKALRAGEEMEWPWKASCFKTTQKLNQN